MAMTKLPEGDDETDRLLVQLATEAVKNARSLQASARAVRDGRQWPMAFSVAALALEELGKSSLCVSMLGMPDAMRAEMRPKFPRFFNSHEAKAACAHALLAMVAGPVPESVDRLMEEAIMAAASTNAVKFRGLYVDYTAIGDILTPQDVTAEQAQQMIDIVEAALEQAVAVEESMERPDVYLGLVRRMRASEGYLRAFNGWEEDADHLLTQTRALAQDEVSLDDAFDGTPMGEVISGLVEAQVQEHAGRPAAPREA
ncbi:AbiV family abortive infection protein [Streptomyces sp. DH12]|uniref:AbiV family abortive infection protein n=1 Tax=Streptomyces sp. DH12 TaxID=2857010 RepID=UPI001E5A09AF|nr:AbiV family abortive infection protein [Streptomyces sp. DH12]